MNCNCSDEKVKFLVKIITEYIKNKYSIHYCNVNLYTNKEFNNIIEIVYKTNLCINYILEIEELEIYDNFTIIDESFEFKYFLRNYKIQKLLNT